MQWKFINGNPVPIKSAAERDAHMVQRHHEKQQIEVSRLKTGTVDKQSQPKKG